MFKFLEIRFLARLNGYLTNRLDRNQIGFVKQMSCQVNIRLLVEKFKVVKECRRILHYFY